MGEILCSVAMGICLVAAGVFYRHFVKKEFEAVRKLNKEGRM
jgi:hypothetical protein